jgi:hypothetical protein
VNLPDTLAEAGLKTATLEVELAGDFTPLTAPTLQIIADQLSPAKHGLALRAGSEWIVKSPSALRLTGSAATLATLNELATVSGYTPTSLDAARKTGRATLYAFETIDLVQYATGDAPCLFERGARDSSRSMDRNAVLDRLRRVGSHLLTHTWTDEKGNVNLLGTYNPMSNRYRPMQANDRDIALGALALDRLAKTESLPDLSLAASAAKDAIIAQLSTSDPIVAAIVVAIAEPDPATVEVVAAALDNKEEPLINRAVAAWSLSRYPMYRSQVRSFLQESSALSQRDIDALLPWIGWADMLTSSTDQAEPVLRSHWEALPERFSRAITATQLPGPARLTSELLRQAAFIPAAASVGDNSPSSSGSLEDVRFLLASLIMSQREASLTMDPTKAAGGVRSAAWDERMSVQSQAFAILALDDIVRRIQPGTTDGLTEVRR